MTSIVLVGLNHRTAPIALREQMALSGCSLGMALQELRGCPAPDRERDILEEVVILSTCNRLELYATASRSRSAQEELAEALARLQGIPPEALMPHLYFLSDEAAVAHLMRVAAGLDSMIVGEPQILGQVASAMHAAHMAGTPGAILSQLFQRAVHAGKRARTETEISCHSQSLSHAAADLVVKQIGDPARLQAVVIGAGDMAELAAVALHERGVAAITCVNRTWPRAQRLAGRVGGRPMAWHALQEALAGADVVITATGAPHTVIDVADVETAQAQRGGRPLVFVDIALPRDVEVGVETISGVQRFDLDHLQQEVDANRARRLAAVPEVEAIVAVETASFLHWLEGRQVLPTLVELRRRAEQLASAELARTLRRLDGPEPQVEQEVRLLAHRLINKILHEPTVRLKEQASQGNGAAYASVVHDLFALATPQPGAGGPFHE